MSEEKQKVKKNKSTVGSDPISLGRAIIDGSNFDEATNSVPVVFATEQPVLTRDWDGELFYEVLSMDKAHIRQDRISSGAPVLDNHDKNGSITKVQLGVVEAPQIVNKEYRATLRFSKRKSIEELVEDIRTGIVKNVSAGYRVYQYRDISSPNDKYRTLLAIDWEPTEVSMVPIPADYKARIRTAQYAPAPTMEKPTVSETETPEIANKNQIEINNRALNMEENEVVQPGSEDTATTENNRSDKNTAEVGKAAVAAERKRGLEIREVARAAKLDDEFVNKHIAEGTSVDKVRKLVIEKWAEKQDAESVVVGATGNAVTSGKDREREGRERAMAECVQIRAFGVDKDAKPETEDGKRAANGVGERRTLIGLARGYLDLAGISHVDMNEWDIAKRAMASTDYPIALADVMNKSLKKRYNAVDPQWKKFATQVDAKDFKKIYGVRVDGSFMPEEITEEGEYKLANFKETGDSFGLKTYGIMTQVTRKMMVNDDLGAFTRFAPAFASGMSRNQAKIVYNLLTQNGGKGRVLGYDNINLFDAAHSNYNAGGSAIMSANAFQAAKTAFMRHVGLDGEPIEVDPKYLVVPPELEILAKQLINSAIVPTSTSQTNAFYGMFEVIVERYLSDPHAWYLAADPGQVEVIKYATLNGQEGIYTEQEYDFKTDNLIIKARNDFNATIEEFVGIAKNDGV